MAKQHGIIPLQGTIGNITFAKTVDGFIARQKGGVSAAKIATHPNFERTRENNAEFRTAAKSARLFTSAFAPLLMTAKDPRMFSRLLQSAMTGIKADITSSRGARNLVTGDLQQFETFEFNANGRLSATLFAPYELAIDSVSGNVVITIQPLAPKVSIRSPQGTTHFAFSAGAGLLNFETAATEAAFDKTEPIDFTVNLTNLITLTCSLPGGFTTPCYVLLGIQFFQEVNGNFYPLNNGVFNALSIVRVSF